MKATYLQSKGSFCRYSFKKQLKVVVYQDKYAINFHWFLHISLTSIIFIDYFLNVFLSWSSCHFHLIRNNLGTTAPRNIGRLCPTRAVE